MKLVIAWSFLGCLLHPVNSFVTLSRHSTQVAFHSNIDDVTGRVITTGVLFRASFKDVTLQGYSDTDCYIANGDNRGFGRAIFETPQMCTHFGIFPQSEDEAQANTTTLPRGFSIGVHDDQALVATVDFTGEYEDLTMTNRVALPSQSFPVSFHSNTQGQVFIGLHKTGGLLPPPAPDNKNDELKEIYSYYRLMTDPMQTTHFVSPEVVKVDMNTQEILWKVLFDTDDGRSTIGKVIHLPSRDLLVVAGSSNGKGSYVGAGEWSNSWDGFITLVNATTGIINDSAANQTYLASEHSVRIQSQVDQDDFILGMCVSDDKLYVTGTTTGKMKPDATDSGGAFLMKVDVDTLNVLWIQQWYGLGTEGIKCTASSTQVYVAGHVPTGVSLKEDTTRTLTTSKTQDLFISLVDANDGSMKWTRQFDSRRQDHLAEIVGLSSGDLLIIGNGMDFEKGISDIYVASITQADGFYDWQGLPPDADPILGATNPVTFPSDTDNENQTSNDKNNTAIIVASTVVPCVILLLIVGIKIRQRAGPRGTDETESPREDKKPETNGDAPITSEINRADSTVGVV